MVSFEEVPDDAPDLVQRPDNGLFTCPVCGDFAGKRSSVEAHITGKSDEAHKGRVGKDFRVPQANGEDLLSAGPPVLEGGSGVTFMERRPAPDELVSPPKGEQPTPTETKATATEVVEEPDSGPRDAFAAGVFVAILVWLLRNTGNEEQAVEMLK
jgi:hypothetical protein